MTVMGVRNGLTKRSAGACWLVALLLLCGVASAEPMRVLTNQLGYEPNGPKRAIVIGHDGDTAGEWQVLRVDTGAVVLNGQAASVGAVAHWKDWRFWTIDFAQLNAEGQYAIVCATGQGQLRSIPFVLQHELLERNTLSNLIYYFKGQRCTGLLDQADHHLKFQDKPGDVDLHGGWWDATGDYGKHLSHLSFSNFFCPQQIVFTDWSLWKDFQLLSARDTSPDKNFRQYRRRLLDEALFGADYLVRDSVAGGTFYRSVDAPGGEKAPLDRVIGKEGEGFPIKTLETKNTLSIDADAKEEPFPYQVGIRNGGGVAVAALAMASTFNTAGDFPPERYLQVAKDAFAFLQQHNLEFAHDGKENILDDYCGLLAATELFKATKDEAYRAEADRRAGRLMGRLVTADGVTDYWRADDATRPFFHAADAGLPVTSLLEYLDTAAADQKAKVLSTVKRSLACELQLTARDGNPFGYARQYVQDGNGKRRVAFFFPHDTEAAPWWQGDDARLASLASAARLALPHFADDPKFQDQLRAYAADQLSWILGRNPYDASMLTGTGRNAIPYLFFKSYEYTNAPGGICNGITAGLTDPEGIEFNLGFAQTGKDEDWRWGEQWLPHASWYLLAVCAGEQ